MSDPLLLNDWHPVASVAFLASGAMQPVQLLEHDLIVWRSDDGVVHAWDDWCPHRGARLSLGRIEQDRVVCGYHGWRFDGSGQCRLWPAQPRDTPPRAARAKSFHAQEAYGMVWVCLGEPAKDLPPIGEHVAPGARLVVCGPYPVQASGPRIIENFLDMAHFGFVHTGILGDLDHTEVPDYKVTAFDDGLGDRGMAGVIATECMAYQPRPGAAEAVDAMVEYSYRVVRPLTAVLTKKLEDRVTYPSAISMHVQPLDEENALAWMVLAGPDVAASDEDLRARQYRIFAQDLAILESQRPKRMRLEPGSELPQRADRLSTAYRRMLREVGLRYGVA